MLIYNFKPLIKLAPTKKKKKTKTKNPQPNQNPEYNIFHIKTQSIIYFTFLLPPLWMLNKENSINCYR